MSLEQQLASLNKDLRRTRRVVVCLAVSLVVVAVAVAAASPFPDLVCRTLQVKSEQGETSIRLEPGKMSIKAGDGFKDVGKKLIDLEGVERTIDALMKRMDGTEQNVTKLTKAVDSSQVYFTSRRYGREANDHWKTKTLAWPEQAAFDKTGLVSVIVPEQFGRKVLGAWCVPLFYEDANGQGIHYIYAEPINNNQVQITYTRQNPWNYAFELVVAYQ